MKLVLLTVVCLAVVCSAGRFTEEEYQRQFAEWQQTHNKAFSSDEFLTRYTIFKGHVDFIHDHNSQNHSYTLGLNHFSHLSHEEFKSQYLTKFIKAGDHSPERIHTEEDHTSSKRGMYVDWRAAGAVTPIRNQGQCGSCWAFSSTAANEGIFKIRSNQALKYLSEQQVLDCTNANEGCNGGWPQDAFNQVKAYGGHDTQASYTYQTAKGSCRYNAANSAATVSGYVNVASGNEAALTSAVNQQPVVVCIDASRPTFQSYSSGVYNDASCSTSSLDHAVTAVGYGNDGAGDYWLIKNSWDTWWGIQGYLQLARNQGNRCGVATDASYPTSTGTGNRV